MEHYRRHYCSPDIHALDRYLCSGHRLCKMKTICRTRHNNWNALSGQKLWLDQPQTLSCQVRPFCHSVIKSMFLAVTEKFFLFCKSSLPPTDYLVVNTCRTIWSLINTISNIIIPFPTPIRGGLIILAAAGRHSVIGHGQSESQWRDVGIPRGCFLM